MNKAVFGLLVLALSASPVRAAGLKLVISDGKVSIDAQDVTVRQILTEWARVGKTRIVNFEGLVSGPITLKLDSVPETIALDIILRAVPGYIAAPRAAYLANASLYDRILIMPTTTAVAARPSAGPNSSQGQAFPPPPVNFTQLRAPGTLTPGMLPEPAEAPDPQDDPAIAAAAAAGLITVPAQGPGPTMFNPGGLQAPFMMPPAGQIAAPSAPSAPASSTPANPWNVPAGVSRPGPAPPAPAPTTPATVIRRPPQADR